LKIKDVENMSKVFWIDRYNTGIAEIDIQHKQIIYYLNRLNDARMKGSVNAVKAVIEGIVDFTLSHFAFEEAIMEQAKYPFASAHKSVHESFIKRVEKLQVRFKAGEDISEELYDFLKRWLVNHIQRDDGAYVRQVKKHLHSLTVEVLAVPNTESQGSWVTRAAKKFFGA
jgi:hemerythrin